MSHNFIWIMVQRCFVIDSSAITNILIWLVMEHWQWNKRERPGGIKFKISGDFAVWQTGRLQLTYVRVKLCIAPALQLHYSYCMIPTPSYPNCHNLFDSHLCILSGLTFSHSVNISTAMASVANQWPYDADSKKRPSKIYIQSSRLHNSIFIDNLTARRY